MRHILSKSLTLRGLINYEFAEGLRRIFVRGGASIADGRVRYREDIVDVWRRRPKPS
jgi:hypothetical protein